MAGDAPCTRRSNSAGIRYLLLGGYAVNYYGYHRSTGDLDVWLAVDLENAAKTAEVLRTWGGFAADVVTPSTLLQKGKIFQFGRVPLRIDLLTDPSGVEFEACYARKTLAKLEGVEVPLISLEDLLVNKRASGRPKDLADVAGLPTPSPHGAPKSSVARRRKRK
jgi:hypothetical protein